MRLLQRGLPHLSRSAQRLFAVDFHTRARGVDSVRLKGTRFKLWAVPALRTIGVDPRAGAPVPGRRGGRAHTQVTPPEGNPHRTSDTLEQEIVELRKHLADGGPGRRPTRSPSTSPAGTGALRPSRRSGWCCRGEASSPPQPQKRPRSSFVRFEAVMSNERWQADITHWALADGTDAEI